MVEEWPKGEFIRCDDLEYEKRFFTDEDNSC